MSGNTPFSRLLAGRRRRLAGLAGLALAGGFAESVVLVVVVQGAVALSGQRPGSFDFGPVHLQSVAVPSLLLVAVVATLVKLGAGVAAALLSARTIVEVQKRLRDDMFDAYIEADWPTQSSDREGGLQQMVGLEVDRSAVAVLTAATGLSAACSLLMLAVAALVVNPVGATALVVVVGGLFFLLRPLARRTRQQASARSADELGMAHSLNELVRTTEEIRVHGVGETEKRRLHAESSDIAEWAVRIHFSSMAISHLYQAAALGLIVAALFVVNRIGATSVAGAGAIVLILLRAFAYSQQLQLAFHQMSERLASVAAVESQVNAYRDKAAVTGKAHLGSVDRLELRSVSYSYGDSRAALSDVSLTMSRGEVIGVIGPSGAGKSTLVQILLRLRSPDVGQYLVNGREARDYDGDDWARLVSYLPQQPKLIAGTVSDNIRFFRDVADADVEAAARKAYLHDEVSSWAQGYDTVIGERSDAVSGGQAQRLCLARALATNPALLILDEPTSALDPMSEHHVQRALAELRGQATIFVIAHRLSTLSICDRLLVLKDSRVERLETRERLAGEAGFYREALRISGLT